MPWLAQAKGWFSGCCGPPFRQGKRRFALRWARLGAC